MHLQGIRCIATRIILGQGALLFPNVLPREELWEYQQEVLKLDYEEQDKYFGKRHVRQDVSSCKVAPGSVLDVLSDRLEASLKDFFGEASFSGGLKLNSRNIQKYADGTEGIHPHRDHASNRNLVVLYGIAGSGVFSLYDDLEEPAYQTITIIPNSLLVMKAPGFHENKTCPVHGVSTIKGAEDGWRYLLGLRQNLEEYK